LAERALAFADAGGLRRQPRGRLISLFGDDDVHLWDPSRDTLQNLTAGRLGAASFHSWAPGRRRLCCMAFEPASSVPPRL